MTIPNTACCDCLPGGSAQALDGDALCDCLPGGKPVKLADDCSPGDSCPLAATVWDDEFREWDRGFACWKAPVTYDVLWALNEIVPSDGTTAGTGHGISADAYDLATMQRLTNTLVETIPVMPVDRSGSWAAVPWRAIVLADGSALVPLFMDFDERAPLNFMRVWPDGTTAEVNTDITGLQIDSTQGGYERDGVVWVAFGGNDADVGLLFRDTPHLLRIDLATGAGVLTHIIDHPEKPEWWDDAWGIWGDWAAEVPWSQTVVQDPTAARGYMLAQDGEYGRYAVINEATGTLEHAPVIPDPEGEDTDYEILRGLGISRWTKGWGCGLAFASGHLFILARSQLGLIVIKVNPDTGANVAYAVVVPPGTEYSSIYRSQLVVASDTELWVWSDSLTNQTWRVHSLNTETMTVTAPLASLPRYHGGARTGNPAVLFGDRAYAGFVKVDASPDPEVVLSRFARLRIDSADFSEGEPEPVYPAGHYHAGEIVIRSSVGIGQWVDDPPPDPIKDFFSVAPQVVADDFFVLLVAPSGATAWDGGSTVWDGGATLWE